MGKVGTVSVPVESAEPFLVVATLVVRRARLREFREFEEQAAVIMARYGGEILAQLLVDSDPAALTLREIHVVSFPDRPAFGAYRVDPELVALGPLRERAIVSTTIRERPAE